MRDSPTHGVPKYFETMVEPARRRAEVVAQQLVGLSGKEARERAARSRCTIRAVRIDGRPLIVTAEYAPNRINVATQDGIIVEVISPSASAEEPHE
jgi:hypothetical protein